MDVIETARQLGVALQADERYLAFDKAKKANDENKELQDLIGEFNLLKLNLSNELDSDKKDDKKVDELNEQIKEVYNKVMAVDTMEAYSAAMQDMETLMNNVNSIITAAIKGEDPLTYEPASGCTGSCSTCGGCH